jgi:hypothetical protein
VYRPKAFLSKPADTWIRDAVKEFVADTVFEIGNSALILYAIRSRCDSTTCAVETGFLRTKKM